MSCGSSLRPRPRHCQGDTARGLDFLRAHTGFHARRSFPVIKLAPGLRRLSSTYRLHALNPLLFLCRSKGSPSSSALGLWACWPNKSSLRDENIKQRPRSELQQPAVQAKSVPATATPGACDLEDLTFAIDFPRSEGTMDHHVMTPVPTAFRARPTKMGLQYTSASSVHARRLQAQSSPYLTKHEVFLPFLGRVAKHKNPWVPRAAYAALSARSTGTTQAHPCRRAVAERRKRTRQNAV